MVKDSGDEEKSLINPSQYDPRTCVIRIADREVKVSNVMPGLKEGEKLFRTTQSICPYCYSLLPALIIEREGKLFIRKMCPEHGEIEELYQGSSEFARRVERWFVEGRGPRHVYTNLTAPCPYSCGLCPIHKNHTALANLVLTNRCDLDCWYCLPGYEVVPVKISDRIELVEIGGLVEGLFKRYDSRPAGEGEYVVPEDLEVLTIKGSRAVWTKVSKAFRRRYEGGLVKIKTKTGKKVTLTKDHPALLYESGGIVRKPAGELAVGDKVLELRMTPIALERLNGGVGAGLARPPASVSGLEVSGEDFLVSEVVEVEVMRGEGITVYDLEVSDETHAFVAGDGILVSNCFFFAEKSGFVYEPTINQIKDMVQQLLKQGVTPAVQLTGGEPALREDIIEIVKLLKEMGVRHIQLNTNITRFAKLYLSEGEEAAVRFSKDLREAGVNTVYMSFDGVSPQANPKNHWEVPFAMEVFRRSGMSSIVLVPTVIKGVNTHELGDIIKFATLNKDVVRSVNIQPVSLTGMIKKAERDELRVTIYDVAKMIEEQTKGQIKVSDWFPVPASVPISEFVEGLRGEFKFEMANHPECGVGTYVYATMHDGEPSYVPITRMIDVHGFLDYLSEKSRELRSGGSKYIVGSKLLFSALLKYIVWDEVPQEIKKVLRKLLTEILIKHDYESLGEWHYKFTFLGMMHFMDLYNYDVERVMRCNVHYLMPDGRVVPFCTFNVLNDVYRDYVQKRYMFTLDDWVKLRGAGSIGEAVKYRRNLELVKKMTSHPLYVKTYKEFLHKWIDMYPWLKDSSLGRGS
ncbi:MAG: radical SAM protein [Zestosphaera sp.]